MHRALLIGFLCAVLPALYPDAPLAADDLGKQHVLVLNSYNRGYKWTDSETEGILDVFAPHPGVMLRIEYMDAKILNTDDYYQRLRDLYALKYRDHEFDAVISTDDDALFFLKKYRDELFGDAPVVFCGVNDFDADKVAGFSRYTGVNESADFRTNLELIARLHPAVDEIYVINDSMTTARSLREEFDAAAADFTQRYRFVYLENIAMETLLADLEKLSSRSLVFYLSFFKDSTGRIFSPEEALPAITAAAAVPVYGAVDYMLGNGIVGGLLKSSYFQGETAARLALRILRGEPVEDIPVVDVSPNHYMFDYHQLKRFGIAMHSLPAGSLVINEPQTFYYKYKRVIWITLAVFAAMTLYIVFLLFNIRKRIRAQRGLQTIIKMTSSIFDYQSLENFRWELMQRLGSLLPLKSELLLFKCDPDAPEKASALSVVAAADCKCTPVENGLSKDTISLIERSIREQKCVVMRNRGVALIKSDYLPGKLILLEGRKRFDDLDRDLLEIFANNVSMSIENLEKMKIEESLETARRIQMSMLPSRFDDFSRKYGVDLYAYLKPAKEVGGDFYDFFAIDERHLCLTVGDVSDKGIPAALFMSMTKSLIRVAAEGNLKPEQILQRVNRELSRENEQSMFVTVFLCILDLNGGELVYANAGHNPPYIVPQHGPVTPLACNPGAALGIFDEAVYTSRTKRLERGDGLFIFSDGVTEAADMSGEFFKEARLEAALTTSAAKTSQALVEEVAGGLHSFTGDASQSDDITILYLRRSHA